MRRMFSCERQPSRIGPIRKVVRARRTNSAIAIFVRSYVTYSVGLQLSPARCHSSAGPFVTFVRLPRLDPAARPTIGKIALGAQIHREGCIPPSFVGAGAVEQVDGTQYVTRG